MGITEWNGYLKNMKKPFLEYRWVEILSFDHAFSMLELDRMPDYGFTGATLWSSFEELDTYGFGLPVVYRKHADLNALRDQHKIRKGADFLREFSRRAHHHGMTVFHTYHLCNFVAGASDAVAQLRTKKIETPLREKRPHWFNEEGEPDFSRDDFFKFMASEVVHPLYQRVGDHHDRAMTDPRAALRKELKRFLAHADAMEGRWGPDFYRRFTPKMREFAADIPKKRYASA